MLKAKMTAARKGDLRLYKRLPVYIEEDHNEVVPHIHRAIGSRHLPQSGIAMVHFDAHPDLLLPLHLQAEHVFDRDRLYSELSIENWILPLVYAGHINEIFWLKPPWADQISDVSGRCFSVGRHRDTGEVRITLDDPYFLTEALYAPESQLMDAKQATLHVITVAPDPWRTEASSRKPFPGDCGDNATSKHAGDACHVKSGADTDSQILGSSRIQNSASVTLGKGEDCEIKTSSINEMREKYSVTDGDLSSPKAKVKKTCDNEVAVCSATSNTQTTAPISDKSWSRELAQKLEGRPYILDIDLDFFSTKDPFQNDLSPEQMAIMRQLFEFKLPSQKSEEASLQFSQARQAQLDELNDIFQHLQEQPDTLPIVHDSHRQMLLNKLIQLLPKSSSSEQPEADFEMLYRAGCTFDGSTLPHHVSSRQQIQQLMNSTANLLKLLPLPTVVTVSRSSLDDYCPQDQVEMIQEDMLGVLKNVYEDIDVHKVYEQQQ